MLNLYKTCSTCASLLNFNIYSPIFNANKRWDTCLVNSE